MGVRLGDGQGEDAKLPKPARANTMASLLVMDDDAEEEVPAFEECFDLECCLA